MNAKSASNTYTYYKKRKPNANSANGANGNYNSYYNKKKYYGNSIKKLPGYLKSYGPEVKALDKSKGALAFSITPTIVLLNGIQQGAAYYNRIGARIELKNIHIRGFVRNTANDQDPGYTSDGGYARVVVVYDRSPNGVIPQISDILQTRNELGATSTTEFSEINLDNRDRFIILRDNEFALPDVTVQPLGDDSGYTQQDYPYNNGHEIMYNEFIKLKGLVTHFKSTSNPATIGDITVGALYIFAISKDSNQDSKWVMDTSTRLRFMDC